MTLERAREIVAAINARCYVHMGLSDDLPSLEKISLGEMLEASAMVKNANRASEAAAKFSGGRYSISMTPDDRLIAAVYAMEHYPISNEPILALPFRARWMRALALVSVKAEAQESEEG